MTSLVEYIINGSARATPQRQPNYVILTFSPSTLFTRRKSEPINPHVHSTPSIYDSKVNLKKKFISLQHTRRCFVVCTTTTQIGVNHLFGLLRCRKTALKRYSDTHLSLVWIWNGKNAKSIGGRQCVRHVRAIFRALNQKIFHEAIYSGVLILRLNITKNCCSHWSWL